MVESRTCSRESISVFATARTTKNDKNRMAARLLIYAVNIRNFGEATSPGGETQQPQRGKIFVETYPFVLYQAA